MRPGSRVRAGLHNAMADRFIGLTPGVMEPWPAELADIACTPPEYKRCLDVLRKAMAEARIDLAYLTTPDCVAWLHGYVANWYKSNGPMRNPQLYETAAHVAHDHFIHFDNPTELPVLGKIGTRILSKTPFMVRRVG